MQKLIRLSSLNVVLATLISSTCFSQNLDINLLKEVNLERAHALDHTFEFVSNSVSPAGLALPALIYSIGLLEHNQELKKKGLYIGESILASAIISTSLKYAVNRPRPFSSYPGIEKLSSGGSPSFPSGHTSEAFATATAMSIAFPKWYVIIPSYAWASAVGYSRMDLGVHYPSDVAAGAIVGAGSAYLCY